MNLTERAEIRRETFYKLTNEGALGNLVIESKLSKGWLNGNGNGQILGPDAKGERTTDFIQVIAGKTYTFQWWSTITEGQKCWDAWQFYDSNRNPFGARGGYGEYGSDGVQHGKRTITAPENACYIRLSFRSFGNGHMMFEAGSGSESFEPSFDDSLKKSNRNLYALSKNVRIYTGGASEFVQNVKTGEISWKTASVSDSQFGGFTSTIGTNYINAYGIKIPVVQGKDILVSLTDDRLIKNYAMFWGEDNTLVKKTIKYTTNQFKVQASQLEGVSYLTFRIGIKENTQEIGTLIKTKVKVEYGDMYTEWSPAPEDLGWTTDTLVPTHEQRYLWKFDYIYYSDDSVEITQPTNLSVAGVGVKSHLITYGLSASETTQPTSWSTQVPTLTKGNYLWTKTTWTYTDNTTETGYQKTYIAKDGNNGKDGIAGKDGVGIKNTAFFYASSTSGTTAPTTGWSATIPNVPPGNYLWTKTVWTYTDNTSESGYTVGKMGETGPSGVNLLHNSKGPFQPNKENLNNYDNWIPYTKTIIYLENGSQYIISAKTDGIFSGVHAPTVESDNVVLWITNLNCTVNKIISDAKTGEAGTVFIWDYPTGEYCLRVNAYHNGPDKSVWDVKIEEGNVKTPYTRNPDDIQADSDSKADQALTQEQLNALAEQNSIVKAEMEAKASIDTVNQWITAYQNYVNANDEAKAESERNLQEASARIIQLKTDVGTLRQQWDFIDTYMTVQNEGLIIGKSDGSAYAKFANDRISLFSGSSEVMYISQGVLRIENGIFTKTIQIGRFRFETHPADQDMLVLRYLGG